MKPYLVIIAVLSLASCQSIERAPKPKNLIPKEKMVDVLYDMSLLDASKRLNRVEVNLDKYDIRTFIFEKYGIDSAQLANSNAYYLEDLKTYKPIIDSVKARLDTLKTRLDTLMNIKKRKLDSITETLKDSFPDKSQLRVKDKLVPIRSLDLEEDTVKKS